MLYEIRGLFCFTAGQALLAYNHVSICFNCTLYSNLASQITVRDPNQRKAANRTIGCFATLMCEDDPAPEHEDAVLVLLSPVGSFEIVYTFRVWEGIKYKYAYTHFMKEGGDYWLESDKESFGGWVRIRSWISD
jgi:hypothetical protein